MTTANLPNWKALQSLLYAEGHQERKKDIDDTAEAFFAAGMYAQALDCALRSDHEKMLESLKDVALEEGNTFLLHRMRLEGQNIGTDLLASVEAKAENLGKEEFAAHARKMRDGDE